MKKRYYTLVDKRQLAPTIVQLTVKPVGSPQPLNFTAGQYASLSLRPDERFTPVRQFSIVSAPYQTDSLQFAMRVAGTFTQTAAQLPLGSQIEVRAPFGSFSLPAGGPTVMIVGGIGITPFMSMLRQAAYTRSNQSIVLIYTCRTAEDLAFAPELTELAKQLPNLRLIFAASDGEPTTIGNTPVRATNVTPEILREATDGRFAGKMFMLCGPTGFMEMLQDQLYVSGVSPSYILTESFAQDGHESEGRLLSPRLIYGGVAAGLMLLVAGIMGRNIAEKVEAYNAKANQAQEQPEQQETTPSSDAQTTTPTTEPTTPTYSSGSAGNGSGSSVTSPSDTYSPPVTGAS